MYKKKVSVVITDIDNTLFDWLDIWYHPFSAMLDKLVTDSEVVREALIPEIKRVHQKYGTVEYAFLIEELPSLQAKNPTENLADIYKDAIAVYREVRMQYMNLYPGVLDSLRILRDKGCAIVAYTESMELYTNYRIQELGLDGQIDHLYTSPNHDFPENFALEQFHKYPVQKCKLKYTKHSNTPPGEMKPNPEVLLDIIRKIGAKPHQCIYIGDNLLKDVAMAQNANITDVFAKYGKAHTRQEYDLLRDVTHWSDKHVEEEKRIQEEEIKPTYVCDKSYEEILSLFEFESFTANSEDIHKFS